MADLNSLIAQGVQFKAPTDPFAQYAQMQQIQQGRNQNELAQYTMGKARQEDVTRNAMNQAYQTNLNPETGEINYPGLYKSLAGANAGASIPGIQKTQAESATAKLTQQKTEGEVRKQLKDFQDSVRRDLSLNPSPENIKAFGQDAVLRGFMTPEQAAAKVQEYLAMKPEELKAMLSASGATAGDLSTAATAKAGQGVTMRGQDLTAATAKAGQAISQGQLNVAQGQLGVARDRLAQENKGVTYQTDPVTGNLVALPNRLAANAIPSAINVMGAGGVPMKAKPSAFAEQATAKKKQLSADLDLTISELENATKKGGLIETSTGSGIGAAYDLGAAVFGQSTKGAEAAGALAPIYSKALMMVPRFEGPQSDKDTAVYNKAAGDFANPAIPKERKLKAANEVLRLLKERKNQFVTRDMANAGATPATPDGVDSSNPLLR